MKRLPKFNEFLNEAKSFPDYDRMYKEIKTAFKDRKRYKVEDFPQKQEVAVYYKIQLNKRSPFKEVWISFEHHGDKIIVNTGELRYLKLTKIDHTEFDNLDSAIDFVNKTIKSGGTVSESLNEDILGDAMDALENEYDWTYVEQEGEYAVRFDYGNASMWVNSDGSVSGTVPTRGADAKRVKAIIKKLGLTIYED